jgi:uncharacterized membrane protein
MRNSFISLCLLVVCYLLGAFINWDINAGNWSEVARLGVIIFWIGLCFVWATYKEQNETT